MSQGLLQLLFGQNPSRFFGSGEAADASSERDAAQFSSWLPYRAVDTAADIFLLADGIGFVLEAMPQSGADQSMADLLRGVFTAPWPAGASLQISLFGTPHIKPLLTQYAKQRLEDPDQADLATEYGRPARNRGLFRALARRRVEHYLKGTSASLAEGSNFLLRDFRLVFSAYLPARPDDIAARDRLARLRDNIANTLSASAFPARRWKPNDLINWCADFCNPQRLFEEAAPLTYDPYRQLRDQIVDIDTRQMATPGGLTFSKPNRGDAIEARFFTVKSYPERFSLWRMGSLIGDTLQNTLQYPCPFLVTMGVEFLDPANVRASVIANQARATQNATSKAAGFMPDVGDKKKDWDEALREVNNSGNLVRVYHTLGLYAGPGDIDRAEIMAESIWRDQGFALSNITFLHRPALMTALPMSFSKTMQRDLFALRISSTKSIENAVHLAPVLAEWRGSQTPVLLFAGRRGQVVGFDLYDNKEGNPHAAVVGTTGSGKSVFLNELAWSYLGAGAKVWMLDLGRSFERLCGKAGGQMLDIKTGSGININPFTHIADFNDDLAMLQATVAKMAAPYGMLDPFQFAAIEVALRRCWTEKNTAMTITDVQRVFAEGRLNGKDAHDQRLTDLAVMLSPYAADGTYAEFFEGPSNVDFTRPMIVIEAESLKRAPALHRVVLMILLYRITSEMYFTRNRRKLLIIDELKQQLGTESDAVLTLIIEEAARRARKYGGSLITATQQVEDYYASPSLLTAFTLSDTIMVLRQRKESIELLEREGKLSINEHKKRILQSLRKEDGAYAELYAFTQMGEGVLRSIIDPFALLMFSNRLEDNAPLDELLAAGHSIDQAIEILLGRRGALK